MSETLKNKLDKALVNPRRKFSFGGFTFVPVFVFSDLGLKATLRDVSPHLIDTGKEPCFTKDPGRTVRSVIVWSHECFCNASNGAPQDIFLCLEDGHFYCPCENTLFRFTHRKLASLSGPRKKKFSVTCTIIYNGKVEVEADNAEDAVKKVQEGLCSSNGKDDFPSEGTFGGVGFSWGEATADYADKI